MSPSHAPRTPSVVTDAVDAMLEALEHRQLMANDPLAVGVLSSGGTWLNVVGTGNGDAIVISQTTRGVYTVANGTWSVTKTGTFTGVRVAAGAGDDSVRYAGPWSNRVSMLGEAGNDTLIGGGFADSLNGGIGDDSLEGGLLNDTLIGDAGNDVVRGGVGNDVIYGNAGNDTLDAGDGNDSLLGDVGNDDLRGGAGADLLNGSAGNDSVDGGADNDKITADLGADTYVGGAGADTLDYTARTAALRITLDGVADDGQVGENDSINNDVETILGGTANDLIVGNGNANVLNGWIGNDTVRGGGGDDRLYGNAGVDSLEGAAGNDSLYGQNDNDLMFGGDGDDLLEGGAGADQSDGGAGRDQMIAVGGGVLDSLTGGGGLDSFWLDSDATEKALDVDAAETAARALHRVRAFVNAGAAVVSKEIAGQRLADPVGGGTLVNFAGNKLFASAGPLEDDITQGSVGDCWYMAGLAAIARTMPEVLRQAITSLGDGTYAVRFGQPGAEKYVRVDADLHTYSWSATTQVYGRTGAEGSTWAPLIEKALTWVRGGQLGKYATISSGWMTETNHYLGLTSTGWGKSNTTSVSSMITWLRQQLDGGKAVTFGTQGGTTAGSNLVGSHAYTVDSVIDNGDGSFSIAIRNPWGGTDAGHFTIAASTLYANTTGVCAGA